MKFLHVRCKVCNEDIFNPDEVVVFQPDRDRNPLPRDIQGRQPWLGMYCICHRCIEAISEA